MDLKKNNIYLEEKVKNIEKRLISLEGNKKRIFQSNIMDEKEEQTIINWIPNANKLTSTELIFDTSRDGDTVNAFKNKCQGQSPTLIIIEGISHFLPLTRICPWLTN